MTVITISRQLGSQGTSLGRLFASRLGYQLVHRELINQAARLAKSPELALAAIDELGLLGIELDSSQQQLYLDAVQTVIENLAQKDDIVIVGRAGQIILQNHPRVFHLRVIAPLETRIQRIVDAHGITRQGAAAQILDSDRYRADYLERFYHINWDDPVNYHLIINTGFMDLETAAETLCAVVRKLPEE
ncbi:cytidylate kinase-like family protein [bacterium]|nr:cytidylate kinase-like family protein [bacterium]MCB2179106.1 cytidylate kinase-like family protein [bacterium]